MIKPKIMQYINKIKSNREIVLPLPSSDDNELNIKLKTILSANDMSSIVSSIVDVIFDNNEYKPEIYDLVFWKAIFIYYTDLDVADINNDTLSDLIYNSEIISLILDNIDVIQLENIKTAIANKINFKKQQVLLEQKQALDKALEDIEFCTEKYTNLLSLFENIDIKEAFNMLKNFSSVSDEKMVNSIMEYKNNKEEK